MAGFKTHFSTSTAVGIGYGAAGFAHGIPLSTCMVGAGACSLAGILPDLDSDSGRPVKEIMSFTAAMIPAMMIPRFIQMGLNREQVVLAMAMVYLAVRFGAGDVFKRYTVHRGMWHSIPAALIVGLIAFLCVSADEAPIRLFKSAAFVLGFLVHLVLDEIWSVEFGRGRIRIKKSFGTALKFFTTQGLWPNLSTYGKLAALVAIVIGDPYLMDQIGVEQPKLSATSKDWWDGVVNRAETRFGAQGMTDEGQQASPSPMFEPSNSSSTAPPAESGQPSPRYETPVYEEATRYEQPPRYEAPPRYQEPTRYRQPPRYEGAPGDQEPPRYAPQPSPTYNPSAGSQPQSAPTYPTPDGFGPPQSDATRTPSYYPPAGLPDRR